MSDRLPEDDTSTESSRPVISSVGKSSAVTTDADDVISLTEYDASDPRPLSEADETFIEDELASEPTKLDVTYTSDGDAIIRSSQYVGVVTLPSGCTVEILPKAADTNLVWLLQYAHGVTDATIDRETEVVSGPTFFDAIGALFAAELETVIRRGIHRKYDRTRTSDDHLRGRLDVHRQLQNHGPQPTSFEVTYERLTEDVPLNQAVTYAAGLVARLVSDPELASQLERQHRLLRKRVTPRRVPSSELDDIQLTRLNDQYADLLELTRYVLEGTFVDEFQVGDCDSFSLLVNMDTIFERTVERAAREIAREWDNVRATGQESFSGLVRGDHAVDMRPDVCFRRDDSFALVVDAKWKTGSVRSSDVYQLAAYQLANDVPGLIVYPSQDGSLTGSSEVQGSYALRSIELPTAADVCDYRSFCDHLENRFRSNVDDLIS